MTWRTLALTVTHAQESFPPQADFETHTMGLYFHGQFGFSLAKYNEFFVSDLPTYAAFRFGSVEVTFGQPSPLIVYMFETYRDKHFHGDWDNLTTVRIYGCTKDEAEMVLLNSFDHYEAKFAVLPRTVEVGAIEWADIPEFDRTEVESTVQQFPSSVIGDIEPLRCMYYAKTNAEPAAACIQYYRVLEYYAFFSLSQELNSLRRDATVSDRAFLLAAAQLLTKDEKGPIMKLISAVATREMLTLAADSNLIRRPEANLLAFAIYDFRNSIVHAKQDQRFVLTVDPVVSGPTSTSVWRRILHQLAKAVFQHSASRRFVGGV